MLRFLVPVCLSAALLCAQQLPEKPKDEGKESAVPAFNPDAPVAVVDDVPITARMLDTFLAGGSQQVVPPPMRAMLLKDKSEAARYLGVLLRLMRKAEEEKLDEKSPLKESLETYAKFVNEEASERTDPEYKKAAEVQVQLGRAFALATAYMRDRNEALEIPEEEIKKFYQDHPEKFTEAKVKVLYIPFRLPGQPEADQDNNVIPTEAEAKEEIAEIQAELKNGADFVALLKKHSRHKTSLEKDGDGTLLKSQSLPESAMAVFSLQPGQVSEPVRWTKGSTGYYLFRLENVVTKTFPEVRAEIWTSLKDQRHMEWLKEIRNSVQLRIINPAYFEKPEDV